MAWGLGRARGAVLAIGIMLAPAPLAAQSFTSHGYEFIKAVRDRDGTKAEELLNKPGNTIIDSRDDDTGETALHITVKRRDGTWLRYMIAKGANLNARDRQGMTPLADAAQIGFADGARLLASQGASVDLPDNRGETPLILAVQGHDLETVRVLVNAGANPRITDNVTGMSALDYAKRDPRSAMILKVLQEAKPVAKHEVEGPTAN